MSVGLDRVVELATVRRVYRDAAKQIDVFAGRDAEMHGYLTASAYRFWRTLDFAQSVLEPKSKILEIGANPYFVTTVLLHELGMDVVCMGRPDTKWPGSPQETSSRVDRWLEVEGKTYTIQELLCNAEREPLPFESKSLDVVFACEILEHLILSPTHFLYEIHRILKPGGHLVLSTPNAAKLSYLIRWLAGKSVWDQYSGYGVYGRHQREFTKSEVTELLTAINFRAVRSDVYRSRRLDDKLATRFFGPVSETLFPTRQPEMTFLAEASGDPKVAFPAGLYRSFYPAPTDEASLYELGQKP